MTRIKMIAAAIVAGGLSMLTTQGCGSAGGSLPPLGKVHGKVTYKGQPLTKGTVTFVPIQGKGGETGQSASGTIESDGSFELTTFNTGDGAILGQHTALVQSRDDPPPPPEETDANGKVIPGKMPDFSKPGVTYKPPQSLIPTKYGSTETSPLKYTVVKEGLDITIELKD